jgi:hypothetical protein
MFVAQKLQKVEKIVGKVVLVAIITLKVTRLQSMQPFTCFKTWPIIEFPSQCKYRIGNNVWLLIMKWQGICFFQIVLNLLFFLGCNTLILQLFIACHWLPMLVQGFLKLNYAKYRSLHWPLTYFLHSSLTKCQILHHTLWPTKFSCSTRLVYF